MSVEGRVLDKYQPNSRRPGVGQQSHSGTNTKLNKIAWPSGMDHGKEFECLMHIFNHEYFTDFFTA